MALTRQDLDKMKCTNPDCTETHPLVLHSRCHPEDPVWVFYDAKEGILRVRCSALTDDEEVCNRVVAEIAVARGIEH